MEKGAVGEKIVVSLLESKGWIVYRPKTSGAHCFDILGIRDKRAAIALDVKAKARLNKYPATGINQKHFEEYAAFKEKHRMQFWVVFVDEAIGSVYGNELAELELERTVEGVSYPRLMETRQGEKIRLWPLEAMKTIASLDAIASDELQALSQRSYDYTLAA